MELINKITALFSNTSFQSFPACSVARSLMRFISQRRRH